MNPVLVDYDPNPLKVNPQILSSRGYETIASGSPHGSPQVPWGEACFRNQSSSQNQLRKTSKVSIQNFCEGILAWNIKRRRYEERNKVLLLVQSINQRFLKRLLLSTEITNYCYSTRFLILANVGRAFWDMIQSKVAGLRTNAAYRTCFCRNLFKFIIPLRLLRKRIFSPDSISGLRCIQITTYFTKI